MTAPRPRDAPNDKAKKQPRKRAAAQNRTTTGKTQPREERTMPLTATSPTTTSGPTAGGAISDKDWTDFLSSVAPAVAGGVAQAVGIDPRLAGQTVSQVLSIFGIGGPGKAWTPTLPQDPQRLADLKQLVDQHSGDPGFAPALEKWLSDALEPVRAMKAGKEYQQPDLSKDWFSDAVSSIGNAVSQVNWQQVAQVGMQILPIAAAALA